MCIWEYTLIPVNVCFRRGGPQRKHCMCVRVYVAVRWDCSIYAVMCHTWLRIHVPFFLPCKCVWCMHECERLTGRYQRKVWRLMTAPRPLMTPSILSLPTRADYPQRHLLTLYANETRRGSNEKRVTDKKKRRRKENQKKRNGKRNERETWNKVCDREVNKRKRTKNKERAYLWA